jgi:hypothetical protein
VTIAELRRRFCLECEDVSRVERAGGFAFIGLPEREASKLQDLWQHDEVGLELSVEVRAPVVVGIYPMRIARFVQEHPANGYANGQSPAAVSAAPSTRPTLGEPIPLATNGHPVNGHANGPTPNGPAAYGSAPNGNQTPTAMPAAADRDTASVPRTALDRRGNGNLNEFASRSSPARGT